MPPDISSNISNSITGSGSLYDITGYTPSNYAAGDVYQASGLADLKNWIAKNPLIFLAVVFLAMAILTRRR